MSEPSRWLRAATKTVGPSPVLAPGILAQSALFIVLATWGWRENRSRLAAEETPQSTD